MNKTSLLLAFAVAALAVGARAQVANWDSPNLAAPCVGEMTSDQPAPATPAAAPAAQAAQDAAISCADGAELEARAIQITLAVKGAGKPLVLDLAFAGCTVEYPRDEPPASPYTRRAYKSAKGDVLGVYSSDGKANSSLSLHLADGSSSASLIPIIATADLASGRTLDLGEVLLVKLTHEGRDGVVIHAATSIKSAPAK
jgi:hypothetical protein